MGALIPVLCRPPSASAFTPLSLSPALWLDSSDLATLYQDSAGTTPVAADGDPVGKWLDKSGNGRHLTQATAAQRPTMKAAVANGRNVVRFDGVDDNMARLSSIVSAQPLTILSVNRYSVGNKFEYVLDGNEEVRVIHGKRNDAGDPVFVFAGSVLSGGNGAAGGYKIQTSVVNGASSILRHNKAQVATGDAGASHLGSGIVVGADKSIAAGFLDGDLCELVIYSSALTPGQITSVESYLSTRWGV